MIEGEDGATKVYRSKLQWSLKARSGCLSKVCFDLRHEGHLDLVDETVGRVFPDEESTTTKDQRLGKTWHGRHRKGFRMPELLKFKKMDCRPKLERLTPELEKPVRQFKGWIACKW